MPMAAFVGDEGWQQVDEQDEHRQEEHSTESSELLTYRCIRENPCTEERQSHNHENKDATWPLCRLGRLQAVIAVKLVPELVEILLRDRLR